MASFKKMPDPVCTKCRQPMTWVSEQMVDTKPVQVFHCDACDKYAAATPGINGIATGVAPNIVTGL